MKHQKINASRMFLFLIKLKIYSNIILKQNRGSFFMMIHTFALSTY